MLLTIFKGDNTSLTSDSLVSGTLYKGDPGDHNKKVGHLHQSMAEATAPKPSSSVKLVLLGEAAVGKVHQSRTSLANWLIYIVLFGSALCKQRLPREQRTNHWW